MKIALGIQARHSCVKHVTTRTIEQKKQDRTNRKIRENIFFVYSLALKIKLLVGYTKHTLLENSFRASFICITGTRRETYKNVQLQLNITWKLVELVCA